MEARCLRVGNKVQDNNGFIFDVVSIFKDGTVYCDFEGNQGDVWEFDNDNPCQGIELTEEILLKFEGIVKLNEFQYKLNDLFLIDIDIISKDNYSIRKVISEESSVFICFMEYLHQFQNIYWCLCGKELNVNI